MSLIRPTHAQALETYWRQLELTPHRTITLGTTTLQCRVDMLKWTARLTNGVVVNNECIAMNWSELGVVPVGGQGLTDNERRFCAKAGRAMARLIAAESGGSIGYGEEEA